MKAFSGTLILILILALNFKGNSQAGLNDPTFNATDIGYGVGDGVTLGSTAGVVNTSLVLPDGKIIICGRFSAYNRTLRSSIARLFADGTLDTSFAQNFVINSSENIIFTIGRQSSGKLIIGGTFTLVNGVTTNRIVRLNVDGSVDATFNVGTGFNASVNSISIQTDDKIIVGGNFGITRLNSNGTVDGSFSASTNNPITKTVIQSDGKILIVGDFTIVNSVAMGRIARLLANGNLDVSFNAPIGANAIINTLSILNDGSFIIGGEFTAYNGVTKFRAAKISATGSLDNSFTIPSSASDFILASNVQADGKILIGVRFYTNTVPTSSRLKRLNINGSLDSSFIASDGNVGSSVNSINILTNNQILIGGSFLTFDGKVKNSFMRIQSNGTADITFNIGTAANGEILTTSLQNNGKIILAGSFTSYFGVVRNGIARIDSNGSIDSSFVIGAGANGTIMALAIQPDQKILIGGNFTQFNGVSMNKVARLNTDGSLDSTFIIGTGISSGLNHIVNDIVIQADGKILIAGNFNQYNATFCSHLIRVNTNGLVDASFTTSNGPSSIVHCIALQTDGKILIGGNFQSLQFTNRNRVARLNTNGTIDLTFNPGTGANSIVKVIEVLPSGIILLGGEFTSFNGSLYRYFCSLTTSGSLNPSFSFPLLALNNIVHSIAIQSDGKIIIGGEFTTYSSTTKNRILRINSNGTLDASFGGGGVLPIGFPALVNSIKTMVIQNNGKLIIGGSFINYDNAGRNRIARVYTAPCNNPSMPTIISSLSTICPNNSATLSINSGNLNDATNWKWYINTCGGTLIDSGTSITVSPSSTTTYYVRGEGGCVNAGSCASITVTVNQVSNTNNSITSAGSYTWSVNGITYTASGVYTHTSLNTFGCINNDTLSLIITPLFGTFNISVLQDQSISCHGNNDGSIQTLVTPFGNYTYSIYSSSQPTNSNTTGFFNQLHPGIYTVCVQENQAPYGTVCDTVTITEPDAIFIDLITDSLVSCNGNDGVMSANITGGTNLLQGYLTWWTNTSGDTINDMLSDNFALSIDSLSAGNYTISVEDDHGCFFSKSSAIEVANPIIVDATYSPILCFGGTTNIVISAIGGIPYLPYTYLINNVPMVTNYGADVYTIIAIDAKGCTGSTILTITEPNLISNSSSDTACNSYLWNGVSYTMSGIYINTFLASNGCDSIHTLNLTLQGGIAISPKVLLSGAYISNGMMHDSLRVHGQIPLLEPYSSMNYIPIGNTGGEIIISTILTDTGSNAIVDWVHIEIRTGAPFYSKLSTMNALIQRDGDVVDVNGNSLYFSNICPGNYHVVIKHRNHLGVMTANAIALNGTVQIIDFTTSNEVWIKPSILNSPRKSDGTYRLLWAGDTRFDRNVKYNGQSNDKEPILQIIGNTTPNNILYPTYRNEDANLDAKVKYNNLDNDKNFILTQIIHSNPILQTPNAVISQHTPN